MTLVFYSTVLNHHQSHIADALFELLGKQFIFVELEKNDDYKGGVNNYSQRPYLLRAWYNQTEWDRAMIYAQSADACVFGGYPALPFMYARMKKSLLSFDMSERWLKKGIISLLSPRINKQLFFYYTLSKRAPLYKLCCSGFAKNDQEMLHTYNNKCYKWGYFTKQLDKDAIITREDTTDRKTKILWCARMLKWKHPELAIKLAERLKHSGYQFMMDLYGTGEELESVKQLSRHYSVEDVISLKGNVSNEEVLEAMRQHDIFLFTSDRNEGWGVVLNEAMSNGCAVVASDEIGSVPFLIRDGENGFIFKSRNLDSLYEKTKRLIDNPELRRQFAREAYRTMSYLWSPRNAAHNLLQLIDNLQHGIDTTIPKGPCSKA